MDGGSGLFVIGLGALLVYAGISGALYRLELTFDLQRRHYRYRRGHLPRLETGEGSFDDIERVVLEKELERRGSDRVDEWEVKLVLRGWPRPIEVLETRDEAPARREAEALAARLGVPLEERTGY